MKIIEKEIIIVRTNKKTWEKITDSEEYYGRCIIFIENELQNLLTTLAYKESKGEFTSYHCKGMTCQTPRLSFEDFIDTLKDLIKDVYNIITSKITYSCSSYTCRLIYNTFFLKSQKLQK